MIQSTFVDVIVDVVVDENGDGDDLLPSPPTATAAPDQRRTLRIWISSALVIRE